MPKLIFDTSVIISYQPSRKFPNVYLSAVVLQELVAGAVDSSTVKALDATRREHEKEGRLVIPDSEDWFLAGKILNSLLRGLKSKSAGLTPKLHPHEKQRIIRDVLIARSAHRIGALVVTDNINDFIRIRRFCKVSLQSGKEFFGRS